LWQVGSPRPECSIVNQERRPAKPPERACPRSRQSRCDARNRIHCGGERGKAWRVQNLFTGARTGSMRDRTRRSFPSSHTAAG
jgi:hypothetical protein